MSYYVFSSFTLHGVWCFFKTTTLTGLSPVSSLALDLLDTAPSACRGDDKGHDGLPSNDNSDRRLKACVDSIALALYFIPACLFNSHFSFQVLVRLLHYWQKRMKEFQFVQPGDREAFRQTLNLAGDIFGRLPQQEKEEKMAVLRPCLDYAATILPNFVPPTLE